MKRALLSVLGLMGIVALLSGISGCGGSGGGTPPVNFALVSSTPAAGATNVPLNTTIRLEFNQILAGDSTITVTVSGTSTAVPGTIAITNQTLVFTPSSALNSDTVYVVNFSGVRNLSNVPPVGVSSFSFTTGSIPPPTNPVRLDVQNAQWVAFQDGVDGAWSVLSTSSGFSGTVDVTAPDGRYSVAYVCSGAKPTVNVAHATRSELPQFIANCGAPPGNTFTVSGSVQGLSGGQALIAIGDAVTVGSGGYTLSGVLPGSYDVIAVRLAGDIPNRVWLQRNRTFNSATTYNIDFGQADSSIVRVLDVSNGAASVSGIAPGSGEVITGQAFFLSGTRASIIGADTTSLDGVFLRYPIIPSSVLNAGEAFRIKLVSTEGRGVEEVLGTLPTSLSYTLPAPYSGPTFVANLSGPVVISATNLAYAESPLRGYLMELSGGNQPVRYRILISSEWLGQAALYSSPVLSGLAGWNANWSVQRGASLDVNLQALVTTSSTSDLLLAFQGSNPPVGFQLRYATRRVTLNL
ncbi:MAG: hypothetical protein KatS3mg019_1073 [Fimbriimonadales bacterium]|nr:MAG: hypothetical protein KatS3mg019_1073 [Fimbriimonadales bacterium]